MFLLPHTPTCLVLSVVPPVAIKKYGKVAKSRRGRVSQLSSTMRRRGVGVGAVKRKEKNKEVSTGRTNLLTTVLALEAYCSTP